MQINELIVWLKKQKKISKIVVKKKKIKDLKEWVFKKDLIYHKTNNFFSIKPFLFKQKKDWFQPLIVQKEQGILGIIKKRKFGEDYYLLQSKIEPGNINGIQISPTVQATKSNYLRKHGGKKTLYLDFFLDKKKKIKTLSKVKLSEQGSRFFNKKNWNILLEVKKFSYPIKENFCWLTKKNIQYLMNKKNILNMDTISVFSSVIQKNQIDKPHNTFKQINFKLIDFKKNLKIKKFKINFTNLKNWKINEYSIFDFSKKFFSIFFIDVTANSREVRKWEQPIISDHLSSFDGFLINKTNNTLHYLLKIIFEPGFERPKYSSTISEKNFLLNSSKNIKYKKFFKKKNFLVDIVNSDEGGRFFKNQTRNIICEIKNHKKLSVNKNFIWASHNQVVTLIKQNKMTIEARKLFASYNIDKIK